MQVGTASVPNPNASWLNSRGMWTGYIVSVIFLNFLLNLIPMLSVPLVWTLTHTIHNVGMYIMFHYVSGTPYETLDQGENKWMTHWEQLDNGEQFTATRKFLTAFPVLLFIIAAFFTIHDINLTVINIIVLLIGVIPKLPIFHRFRLTTTLEKANTD